MKVKAFLNWRTRSEDADAKNILLKHDQDFDYVVSASEYYKLKGTFFILERLQNANSWHCTVITSVISVRITITSHYSKCSTLFTCDLTKHVYNKINKKKICRLLSIGCSRISQTQLIYFYSQYFLPLCNHCVIDGRLCIPAVLPSSCKATLRSPA